MNISKRKWNRDKVSPWSSVVNSCYNARTLNLPGKMDRALAEEDSPGRVEEIPSEAMGSTTCKLL